MQAPLYSVHTLCLYFSADRSCKYKKSAIYMERKYTIIYYYRYNGHTGGNQ